MAAKRSRKTRLPRITMLALNRAELVRFSEAAESIVHVARQLTTLFNRLDELTCTLEAVANAEWRAFKKEQGKKKKQSPATAAEPIESAAV